MQHPSPPPIRFIASLTRKRGWSDAERETQTEKVLGYRRKETDLTKQDASKLIEAWNGKK